MGTDKEQITIVKKEMGITHKNFYSEIPNLLEGIPYHHNEYTIQFQIDNKNVEITLGPEGLRKLGQSVKLPVTPVTICFFSFSKDQISAFIKHFNLKFMKGGG